jgi:hypothetical protein
MVVRQYGGHWRLQVCSEVEMIVEVELPLREKTESPRIHRHRIVMLTVSEVVAQVLVAVG